jgi:hypothetical protein
VKGRRSRTRATFPPTHLCVTLVIIVLLSADSVIFNRFCERKKEKKKKEKE